MGLLGLALSTVWWTTISAQAKPSTDAWVAVYDEAMRDAGTRYHRADYEGSRTKLEQALLIARENDSLRAMALTMHVQGMHAQQNGDFKQAKTLYLAERKIRGSRLQPVIDEALGDVETLLKEYGSASRVLVRSFEGFRQIGDPMGMAMATRNLGSVALAEERLDEADAHFLRSLELVKGLGKRDLEADVRGRQALVLLKRGRKAEARETLAKCLAYWKAKAHPRWVAGCEMRLALAETSLDDRPSALERLARSRTAYLRLGDSAGAADAAAHLRDLAPPTP